MLEGLESIPVSALLCDLTLLKLAQEASVVLGITQDGDALVVLGSSADEGHATDIDLLDSLGDADVDLGDGVLEGIEVADNKVHLVDVLVGEILLIGSEVTGEDARVNRRVKGLDATGKHFGGLSDGRDVPVGVCMYGQVWGPHLDDESV